MDYISKAFGPKVSITRRSVTGREKSIQQDTSRLPKNARVIFAMDVSGSMCRKCKERGAAIMQLTLQELRTKYDKVSHSIIGYHTKAHMYKGFKDIVEHNRTGGTITSTSLDQAIKLKKSSKHKGDTYFVLITDGDNWLENNERVFALIDDMYKKHGFSGVSYHEVGSRVSQEMGQVLEASPYVDSYFHGRPVRQY